MTRKYLPIVAIAALVIAGLCVIVWTNRGVSEHPYGPEKIDPATYTNSTYGFEIAYPQGLFSEGPFQEYYVLSNKWRVAAPEGQQGVALVTIPIFSIDNQSDTAAGKPYPLYFTAEVRVGASSDLQAVAECLKTDPGYADQKHEAITLNGTQFERFEFADAAMMQYVQGVSYRTVRDNTCFAIEQLKAGSTYRDESMAPGISDSQLDAYYAQAGEVIESFRFIR